MWVTITFAIIGAAFMLLSSIGMLRMPDLYLRMSASTKSATLGVSAVLIAAAIHFGDLSVTARAVATIIFVLITAPVAAHMIGRAAYMRGVPLWKGTHHDDLVDHYKSRSKPDEQPSNSAETSQG